MTQALTRSTTIIVMAVLDWTTLVMNVLRPSAWSRRAGDLGEQGADPGSIVSAWMPLRHELEAEHEYAQPADDRYDDVLEIINLHRLAPLRIGPDRVTSGGGRHRRPACASEGPRRMRNGAAATCISDGMHATKRLEELVTTLTRRDCNQAHMTVLRHAVLEHLRSARLDTPPTLEHVAEQHSRDRK